MLRRFGTYICCDSAGSRTSSAYSGLESFPGKSVLSLGFP